MSLMNLLAITVHPKKTTKLPETQKQLEFPTSAQLFFPLFPVYQVSCSNLSSQASVPPRPLGGQLSGSPEQRGAPPTPSLFPPIRFHPHLPLLSFHCRGRGIDTHASDFSHALLDVASIMTGFLTALALCPLLPRTYLHHKPFPFYPIFKSFTF